MASSEQVHQFYAQWFPTVRSFATLYLGDEEEGTAAAVQEFCEYSRTGLLFEIDELPLVLWECAAESAQERASITGPERVSNLNQGNTKFDKALMLLSPDERLAFLLHTVYGLPTAWIMLVTGWPAQTIAALREAASSQVRKVLRPSMQRANPTSRV